ncbi:MAG: DUF3071 domain-containing protein [Propionibacteriales bacterium]|nr:DUF3071 domain-containing protein [Propionibacteriales bacterium]
MESALSPREIQARVRAGDSVEDVARAAGMSVDWVEPFAAPVIAEREYIAQLAQSHQVRRGGETIPHRNLGQVVADRLGSRRVDTETLDWDAWRLEGRRWLIRLDYDSGKAHREARFVYDANGRFSVADNDDARWLVGLQSASHGPQPGRRRREDDAEPTVDLNDDLALVRVVQPRADELPVLVGDADGEVDDAYAEAELAEVNGIYDILPNQTGGLDVLYDMLSSFDEDSVQIYAGLIRDELGTTPPIVDEPVAPARKPPAPIKPVAAPEPAPAKPAAAKPAPAKPAPAKPAPAKPAPVTPAPVTPASAASESAPVADPQPSLEEAAAEDRPRTRRKRAEVPSWDEIMFGAPKNRS